MSRVTGRTYDYGTDPRNNRIRCDGLGCEESHPIDHDLVGKEPGFDLGRWLGWVYLDLNREDLYARPFRFCSTWCCMHWLEREIVTTGRKLTDLDRQLRRPVGEPTNEVGVKAALHELRAKQRRN